MIRTHWGKRVSVAGSIGLFLRSLLLALTSVTAFASSSMQIACEMVLVCAPISHTRKATRASTESLRKRMPDRCLATRLSPHAYL